MSSDEALAELRDHSGRVAELAREDGVVKLDWVDAVPRLLDGDGPDAVDAEAAGLWDRGIRHVIWAGMGGSVMAVRVLIDLGITGDGVDRIAVYPLDSTDPAALNAIIRLLAARKRLSLPTAGESITRESLRAFLSDVLMVGVAMGMTSEEPITHLAWFSGLLDEAGLDPADHLLIMALPGSLLECFALDRGAPRLPLQLDGGNGTPGRMSAPGTRVFLLPAALSLASPLAQPGRLRSVLQRGWEWHERMTSEHPFVRLADAMNARADDGVCRVLLALPDEWRPVLPWIEQLMEESLGKGGKGVLVFDDQRLLFSGRCYTERATLRVQILTPSEWHGPSHDSFALVQPHIDTADSSARLSTLVSTFLGWQVTMALYGRMQNITFAGQPAVESYKTRARILREAEEAPEDALPWDDATSSDSLTVFAPPGTAHGPTRPEAVLAAALDAGCPRYLDLTINGEMTRSRLHSIRNAALHLGNERGLPVKVRRAPAAYHATEQSEMDGPNPLVSIRLLASTHEPPTVGVYDDRFLRAQAVATWQSMVESGRSCFLVLLHSTYEDAGDEVERLLSDV